MFNFLKSTVGRKYLMGITGLVWAGFVFTHMAGNMLILFSAEAYNSYGHAIVSNKPLLFGTEIVLIGALVVHVACAVALTGSNRAAKGIQPTQSTNGFKKTSFASKTMAVQGSLILAFLISHILTFKFGAYYETTVNGVVIRDLAKLIFEKFHDPVYVGWYILSLSLLGFHLSHGFGSIFQSFGLLHPAYQPKIKVASCLYAAVVSLGFLSQPIFVFLTR